MNNSSVTSLAEQINGLDFKLSTNPTILIIVTAILSAIDGFTIIANLTVVSALVRSRKNISRDVARNNGIATMMMTSLALSDGLIGVLVMPLGLSEVINNGKWYLGQGLCVARWDLNNTLNSVSIFHIVCMAIDRYLAVCKPLSYRIITTKVGFIMIGAAWLLPVILILLPSINGWEQRGLEEYIYALESKKICARILNKIILGVSVLLSFYVPLAATYTLCFLTLRDIQNFSKRRRNYLKVGVSKISGGTFPKTSARKPHGTLSECTLEPTPYLSVGAEISIENTIFTTTARNNPIVESPHSNQNLRAYKTIGALLACFTMCWLPLGLLAIALLLMDYTDLPLWLGVMLNWVSVMTSALNPVLYFGNTSVRRAVLALLGNLRKFFRQHQ